MLVRAAISVLATGGSRALTHRAVDAAADVPAGATSNCFRTRAGLLAGVLEQVLATETDRYRTLPTDHGPTDHGPPDPRLEALARDVRAMVDHLTGPNREATIARLALAVEASWDPTLRAMLDAGRGVWHDLTADRMRALGVAEPDAAADGLLALVDGLVLDRLRGRPGPDPGALATALITGLERS